MSKVLKYRYVVLLPLLFYRYSVGSHDNSFLGINSSIYLITFSFLSLILLGIDIAEYTGTKTYQSLYIKDQYELMINLGLSIFLVIYSADIFLKGNFIWFLVIAIIYLLYSFFWGIVLLKARRIKLKSKQ